MSNLISALQLDDGDNAPEYIRVTFDALVDVINGGQEDGEFSTSACKAARTINSLRRENQPEASPHRRLAQENFLYRVWSTMFETVEQLSSEHDAIQKVVDGIAEPKKLDVATLNIWGRDIRLCTELPLLGPEFLELRQQLHNLEYENTGLKVFRDKLEADGIITLFNP